MKQHNNNQYDDDLTVATDEYDEFHDIGAVDSVEPVDENTLRIKKLKRLIWSIEREITDEALVQFNEELLRAREAWNKEKINLVYVQALEKISKYIYQKKSQAHPNAIKLLLIFFVSLEKILVSTDLVENQKIEILLEDIKKFKELERQISTIDSSAVDTDQEKKNVELQTSPKPGLVEDGQEEVPAENKLLDLKALILGIDWEITDDNLTRLRYEVLRAKKTFTGSKPKIILLQGIGTIVSYIKIKKNNAHTDAFKVLQLFYKNLEKMVTKPMSLAEEKAILLPAVDKFYTLKTLLDFSHTSNKSGHKKEATAKELYLKDSDMLAPSLSGIPDNELKSLQIEKETEGLDTDNTENVGAFVDDFFSGNASSDPAVIPSSDIELALQGVEVEGESTNISLPVTGNGSAPVLEESDGLSTYNAESVEEFVGNMADGEELFKDIDDIFAEQVETSMSSDHEITKNSGSRDKDIDDLQSDSDLEPAGLQENESIGEDSSDSKVDIQISTLNDDKEAAVVFELVENQAELVEDMLPTDDPSVGDIKSDLVLDDFDHDDNALAKETNVFEPIKEVERDAKVIFDLPADDESSSGDERLEKEEEGLTLEGLSMQDGELDLDPDNIATTFADSDQYVASNDSDSGPDITATLRANVALLEGELNDRNIEQFFQELNKMHERWYDKPLEKTFLELLSTIIRHIDQYRDESNNAKELLQSICKAMTELSDDIQHNQELVLTETVKVLCWQQDVFARYITPEEVSD